MIARIPPDSFRRTITEGGFPVGAEVPTTDTDGGPASAAELVRLVRGTLDDPRIAWICITDRAHGDRLAAPDYLSDLQPDRRSRVVMALSCRDGNRNGLASVAWSRYAAHGLDNVLAVTGEYPLTTSATVARPVFDVDSLGLIALLKAMNEGRAAPGWDADLRTDFYIGCVVSPFKRHERELVPQYFKLVRKIAAGAQWVISQFGYDARKSNEVRLILQRSGLDVPVIGNVHVLTRETARMLNRGARPGCVVSDELLALADRYGAGPDKGRAFFRDLAARQLAIFKGLGFAAGYLGGAASPEAIGAIIAQADQFGPNDWQDLHKEVRFARPDEYFLFEHDPQTGLSDPTRLSARYLASLQEPRKCGRARWSYRLARYAHDAVLDRDNGLSRLLKRLYRRWDARPGLGARLAYRLENRFKSTVYGCQACGDCALHDCAYQCPMAACPKHARNGPCGDSDDGRCSVTGTECLWATAYERLKCDGATRELLERPVRFYDAERSGRSSWASAILGRKRASIAAADRPAPHEDSHPLTDALARPTPPQPGPAEPDHRARSDLRPPQ